MVLSKDFQIVPLMATFFAIMSTIVVLTTTSNRKDTLQQVNWAYTTKFVAGNATAREYVNVYQVGVQFWGLSDDKNFPTAQWDDCQGDYCNDCQNAMLGSIACVALVFIFNFPSFVFNYLKWCKKGNTSFNRLMTLVFGGICALFGIIALIIFSAACYNKITEDDILDLTWHYGAAFGCLLVGVLLQFFSIIFNILIDVDSPASLLSDKA